jgi:hypothetical protein
MADDLLSELEKSCDVHTLERFLTDVRAAIEHLRKVHGRNATAFGVVSTWSEHKTFISPEEAREHRRNSGRRGRRPRGRRRS